jgi:hypothetical protein
VLMPLLTELHSEGRIACYKHGAPTALVWPCLCEARAQGPQGRDYRSDRETLAARAVRDRIRIGDFETAFLQVFAVI